jgi:hypothetical protein
MLTLRKKLAEILEQESLDLQEISQFLGIKEKEVLDHLQHIAKSARSKRLAVELGLGASSPEEIEVFPADEKSRDDQDRIVEILRNG